MPSNKAVIGIVGEIAAGKGVAAKYLQDKYGAAIFKFSTPMRDCLRRLHLPETRENLQLFSKISREAFGQDLYSKTIALDAAASASEMIITDGIRRLNDAIELAKLPYFHLLAIAADERVRYERVRSRDENPGDAEKTWEQFSKEAQAETEVTIREVAAQAEFTIENNGTLDDLHAKLDMMMAKLSAQ